MNNILVIAPHADDETLGCGGAMLRFREEGRNVSCLIVTSLTEQNGWPLEKEKLRKDELAAVNKAYRFDCLHELGFPPAGLDKVPFQHLVEKLGSQIERLEPSTIFCPYLSDVHTDHQITAKAVASLTKWFRCRSLEKVLAYETLSETEFNVTGHNFNPNSFINIESYLEKKIEIFKNYKSELSEFPFPRSEETIRALAQIRGSQAGYKAAEAFMVLFEKK